ncbi:MAG: TRAP transporter small permease [Gammaproteobacteria bacterium]
MRTIVTGIESVLAKLDVAIRVFVVFALLSMTALLFLNSIGRSALNISFVGGPALGRLIVIWLTFLGSYLAVRMGTHITVDVVRQALPKRIVSALPIPVGIAGALTTAWIAWLGARFTLTRFASGQIDPMLEIPSAWFYLPVPIGCALMSVAFLQVTFKALANSGRADGPDVE